MRNPYFRFPSSALIKNIYRKNSSMVGRAFLLRASYQTVQDIRAKINQRNLLVNRWDKKPMSLSTVSKVLKTLQDDLIVSRKETVPGEIRTFFCYNHLYQPSLFRNLFLKSGIKCF